MSVVKKSSQARAASETDTANPPHFSAFGPSGRFVSPLWRKWLFLNYTCSASNNLTVRLLNIQAQGAHYGNLWVQGRRQAYNAFTRHKVFRIGGPPLINKRIEETQLRKARKICLIYLCGAALMFVL